MENFDIAADNHIPSIISINITPCASFGNQDMTILIAIKSYVGNYDQRMAIRKTWGGIKDPRIKRVFFVGESEVNKIPLEAENDIHLDIVQGSFQDKYYNNTYKMLVTFKWIDQFCSNTKYVLLLDDDYFVNIKNILSFVKDLKRMPNPWWMFGSICWWCTPDHFKVSKWSVSFKEYKYIFYPKFHHGGSILTTFAVIKKMIMVAPHVKYFRFDDVYIGMLADVLGLDLYHEHRFKFHPAAVTELDKVLTSHGFRGHGKLLEAWRVYSNYTITT